MPAGSPLADQGMGQTTLLGYDGASTGRRRARLTLNNLASKLDGVIAASVLPELRSAFVADHCEDATRVLAPAIERLVEALLDRPKVFDDATIAGELHRADDDPRRLFVARLEPAARRLGDLWAQDEVSELVVTLCLCRLQTIAHLLSVEGTPALPASDTPRILVAPLPGELHHLGAVLDSESLWRSGWAHSLRFASDDNALQGLLTASPYDVLDLSLSAAFWREDLLGDLSRRLRGFRAASCNPTIRIRVVGRVFGERPWLAESIGADAVSGTCHALRRHLDQFLN